MPCLCFSPSTCKEQHNSAQQRICKRYACHVFALRVVGQAKLS